MFKQDKGENQLIDKVVYNNRVAKVFKGGRRFSFSAIVVVGDGEGSVGFGLGKAGEVPEEYQDMFEDMWPQALLALKLLCEQQTA